MSFVTALGISILYLVFIRIFAGLIVWITCFAWFAFTLGVALCLYYDIGIEEGSEMAEKLGDNRKNFSYVMFGIFGVSFLIFLCLYHRIKLAVAVLKTGANFIGNVKSSLLIPIFILVPYALFLGIYLIGFLLVYSGGDITYPSGYASVTLPEEKQYYLWYWTFMFLWLFAFLDALTQFTLASTVAIWYFS